MAFKITPVETYDAAYPRRRANTAATSRRPSLLRWLLTVVLGMFLALFSSACGDGTDDGNGVTDGDNSDTMDTLDSDDDAMDQRDDTWDQLIGEEAPSEYYTDLPMEAEMDDDPDIDDWDVVEGDNHPMDPDPPMETEVDDGPDINDWDGSVGIDQPYDPDPPTETENDAVDQWDDAWEQPDKPGPDGDEEALTEEETEDEYEGLTGLVDPAACAKPR